MGDEIELQLAKEKYEIALKKSRLNDDPSKGRNYSKKDYEDATNHLLRLISLDDPISEHEYKKKMLNLQRELNDIIWEHPDDKKELGATRIYIAGILQQSIHLNERTKELLEHLKDIIGEGKTDE